MATDIDNTSSFSKVNMKPEVDEETTALWAQNIADNTGYLYNLPVPLLNFLIATKEQYTSKGTFKFMKDARFNTIVGTSIGTWETSQVAGFSGTVFVDAIRMWGTIAATVTSATLGTTIDVSSLTDGQVYDISFRYSSGNNAEDYSFAQTFWGTQI